MAQDRPVDPAVPVGMDIVIHYICPHCRRRIRVPAPTQPGTIACPQCRHRFPIVPADERTLAFIRIMTADGAAAANPDFL